MESPSDGHWNASAIRAFQQAGVVVHRLAKPVFAALGRLIVPVVAKGSTPADARDSSPGTASALPSACRRASPRGRRGSVCTRRRS